MQSPFGTQLNQEISLFIISLLLADGAEIVAIFPMIRYFFASSYFDQNFGELGGIFALWALLSSTNKLELTRLVFAEIANRRDGGCSWTQDFLIRLRRT
jgi:hypothetical protein